MIEFLILVSGIYIGGLVFGLFDCHIRAGRIDGDAALAAMIWPAGIAAYLGMGRKAARESVGWMPDPEREMARLRIAVKADGDTFKAIEETIASCPDCSHHVAALREIRDVRESFIADKEAS